MEQAGAITSSLVHEINQPLTGILSNVQAGLRFLDRKPPALDEVRAILKDIVRDEQRAHAIIGGVRSMLRRQDGQQGFVDLGSCVEEVLNLVRREFVACSVEVHPSLPSGYTVLAHKAQIQQVVLNPIMNAIDALRDGQPGQRHLWLSLSRTEEGKVQVEVRDSGVGIAPELLERVFDGFYTTKNQGSASASPYADRSMNGTAGRSGPRAMRIGAPPLASRCRRRDHRGA